MTRQTTSIVVGALALFVTSSAWAALGEAERSVAQDQLAMNAERVVSAQPSYSVHEIQLTSGTLVREFVSRSGQVFGVAWGGPFMPDLRQLLGRHFDKLASLRAERQGARGHLLFASAELVIETGGHMRAWVGRAYLPTLVPEGVASSVIR